MRKSSSCGKTAGSGTASASPGAGECSRDNGALCPQGSEVKTKASGRLSEHRGVRGMLTEGSRRELLTFVLHYIGIGPSIDAVIELIANEVVDNLPGQLNAAATARWIDGNG